MIEHEEAGESLDFPSSQLIQAVSSACREVVVASSAMYFPKGQLVQLDEAAVEYFPKEQMTQDVLPCSENFPASPSSQPSSESALEAELRIWS